MPSERLGILIPACSGGSTIEAVVRGALGSGGDLLVVDDGSADGSGDRAAAAGARVLRHARNLGKGAALATGFADLLGRGAGAVITLDADGQHDPADIPSFLEARRVHGSDLIVGARLEAFERMSGSRRFGNRFSCAAVRFFGGPALPDTQCGFRLYSRRLLEAVPFRRRRYDAEIEILMRAAYGGFAILPMPVRSPLADGRGTSHYRPWADTARMCWAVVRLSLAESRRPHPLSPRPGAGGESGEPRRG